MRRSTYTIEVEHGDSRVWINSLTGAIDLLPARLAARVADEIETVPSPTLAELAERGHVTDLDEEGEKSKALEAWALMDGVHRQRAKIVICPSIDCNFRCGYCFEAALQRQIDNGSFARSRTNLTVQQVDAIFDNLNALLLRHDEISDHITLFGGEPLWDRNLAVVEYLVARARREGYSLSAISNGHDLTTFAHLLGPHGIHQVQVSLDGPKEVHDRMRPFNGGGTTFDRIVAQLQATVDIPGFHIDIRMNYDSSNMQSAPVLHDQLTEAGLLGRDNVSFHANLISMNHAGEGKDFATLKQYAEVSARVPDAELDCYTKGLRDQLVRALDTGEPLARRAHFCAATSGMYVFCPDGDIYSCWEGIGEAHSRIGSFDEDIRWNDGVLRQWHARTAPAMPKCQSCSHLFLCAGGCTVHAIELGKGMNVSQCDGLRKKYRNMVQRTFAERDLSVVRP